MRRSRIKVTASVPLRRKVQKENEENSSENRVDVKVPEKPEAKPQNAENIVWALPKQVNSEENVTEAQAELQIIANSEAEVKKDAYSEAELKETPQNVTKLAAEPGKKSISEEFKKEAFFEAEIQEKLEYDLKQKQEASETVAKPIDPTIYKTNQLEKAEGNKETRPEVAKVSEERQDGQKTTRVPPKIVKIDVKYKFPHKESSEIIETDKNLSSSRPRLTAEFSDRKEYESRTETPVPAQLPSSPAMTKTPKITKPAQNIDSASPRRPRLLSESTDTRGHLSGSETTITAQLSSAPAMSKIPEITKPAQNTNSANPRRPRLFSESSDTRGHLSGSETNSPTKLHPTRPNFMRPTPRLDGTGRIRRNSIQGSGASASESEDDSRRHHPGQTLPTPPMEKPAPAATSQPIQSKLNSKQKRKLMISESARKLAEARREFLLKHENKQPDRAKLTMYDLIYYNPATNPMKKSVCQPEAACQPEEDVIEEEENEEEDEDDAMPVPQLKVGPDGQIMVDEQSLVVENTVVKKGREALAKRRVLVDEEGHLGGFYKKRTKTKEWSNLETLKFYKALNTVGTDFSLMQSVFPKRSRQELKMKFKKEEKLNRRLIEKALTFHQEYDIEMLKKDLESFEGDEERLNVAIKRQKEKKTDSGTRKKRARKRNVATSLNMASDNEDENVEPLEVAEGGRNDLEVISTEQQLEREKSVDRLEGEKSQCNVNNSRKLSRKGKKSSKKDEKLPKNDAKLSKNGIGLPKNDDESPKNDVGSSKNEAESPKKDDESPKDGVELLKKEAVVSKALKRKRRQKKTAELEAETDDSESPDDFEVYKVKPTRSGRLPKKKRPVFSATSILDEMHKQEPKTDEVKKVEQEQKLDMPLGDSVEGLEDVEAGSLVIIHKESPHEPGKTVVQVYMVSQNMDAKVESMAPVNVEKQVLSTVTDDAEQRDDSPLNPTSV